MRSPSCPLAGRGPAARIRNVRPVKSSPQVDKAPRPAASCSPRLQRGAHPMRHININPAWMAVVISLVAVGFSGLQWYEAHEQKSLSVRPSLSFIVEDRKDKPIVGVGLDNGGPGPAVIKSVAYYVDRKAMRDAGEAQDYCKLKVDPDGDDLEEGDALAAGKEQWLFARSTKNKRELDQFIDCVDQHLAVEVSYCALDGECWKKCSTKGRC